MKKITTVSSDRDCFIELIHRDSDPGTWIVKYSKKILLFKKRISSDWFNDRQQALVFANEMKQGHDGCLRGPKEILQYAE